MSSRPAHRSRTAALRDDAKLAAFAVTLATAEAQRPQVTRSHSAGHADHGHDSDDGGYGAHVVTLCARVQQFEQEAAALRARKSLVVSQRAANARHLFQLWRTTGVDITKGRHAVVARDPEAPWTSGLVKLRGQQKAAAAAGTSGSAVRPAAEMRPLSPFNPNADEAS